MGGREPATETMDVNQVKDNFNQVLSQVSDRQTRVLVRERDKALAGIVPVEDLQRLDQLDAEWDDDWRVIGEIQERNRDKTEEEVATDVAEAIAAVRKEPRRPKSRTAK